MAGLPEEPPEKKLSPWKQFLEDLSWDIPFARAFGNLFLGIFIEEGKAVRSGWLAFLVFTVFAFLGGRHYSERNIDVKIAAATNYFGGVLAGKESDISKLQGALADAKADRDKNQLMLAPFQAMALKLYTNEPLEQRLDLLANELGGISKQANVGLGINGNTNLFASEMQIGSPININNFITLNDRKIRVSIYNWSKFPAVNASVDFVTLLDATNLSLAGWNAQPQGVDGENHWDYYIDHSIGKNTQWNVSTIEISTNFLPNYFIVQFGIGADNAESEGYIAGFKIEK